MDSEMALQRFTKVIPRMILELLIQESLQP